MPINKRDYDELEQEGRFYPESVPFFEDEPIQKYFIIVKSPEPINEGVISRISFKATDTICKWTGFHLPFQTLHSLQHTEDKIFIHDPYFVGKFLHSCNPNCELDMNEMSVTAIRDIQPLDKLTLNYNKTEKLLYQGFYCQCGSDGCIGYLEGYGSKSIEKPNKDS